MPEDQSFSILPTSLWITDVDADEETRTGVPTASAGEVLVSSSVSHGTIRFFPSGDFDSVEGLSFLNASDEGVGCNAASKMALLWLLGLDVWMRLNPKALNPEPCIWMCGCAGARQHGRHLA